MAGSAGVVSGNLLTRVKCRLDTEPAFDAGENILQVWFGDLVEDLPAGSLAVEESAALHEPQVF